MHRSRYCRFLICIMTSLSLFSLMIYPVQAAAPSKIMSLSNRGNAENLGSRAISDKAVRNDMELSAESTNQLTSELINLGSRPIGVFWNPANELIYAVTSDGIVSIIRGSTIIGTINLGTSSYTDFIDFAVNNESGNIYLHLSQSKIFVINGAQLVSTINFQDLDVRCFEYNPVDHNIYVNLTGLTTQGGPMAVIDGVNIINYILLPGSGYYGCPHANPLNGYVYATSTQGYRISIFNATGIISSSYLDFAPSWGGIDTNIAGYTYVGGKKAYTSTVAIFQGTNFLGDTDFPSGTDDFILISKFLAHPTQTLTYAITDHYSGDSVPDSLKVFDNTQFITTLTPTGSRLSETIINPISQLLYVASYNPGSSSDMFLSIYDGAHLLENLVSPGIRGIFTGATSKIVTVVSGGIECEPSTVQLFDGTKIIGNVELSKGPKNVAFSSDNSIYLQMPCENGIRRITIPVITYTISGNVHVSQANLDYIDKIPKTVVADKNGNYSIPVSENWTGTIIPSKPGFTFSPSQLSYSNVQNNLLGQDYVAKVIPFLDLPLSYDNFQIAAQGSNGGGGPGYVNSWFDHTNPGSVNANNLTTWLGPYAGNKNTTRENCTTLGESCYDGHDGIDLRHTSDEVLAAAPGTVFGKVYSSTGFGNHLYIDHHNCFATLYGHLSFISVNNTDTVVSGRSIGVMGNSGLSLGEGKGIHLHFGVYYDPSCDGNWSDMIPVDPYPWKGEGKDPWQNVPDSGLWKHTLSKPTQVDPSGGTASSPGDTYNVNVPAGAVTEVLTFELLSSPPVSAPSAQVRSTGYSFWIRIWEWLAGGNSTSTKLAPSSLVGISANSFNAPVTITINFDPLSMLHIDANQLAIQQWDELGQSWTPLPTTIDAVNHQASAETTQPGHFDLEGPLVCPSDTLEPNDNYDSSSVVPVDGTLMSNLFDIAQDVDWFQFNATANNNYTINTTNLSTGVDTILEVYDTDGVTLLGSDDNSGGSNASSLTWQAPNTGVYFVRVRQNSGSIYGCSTSYSISVKTPTFADVSLYYWSWSYIERLFEAGITSGCSANPSLYCPSAPVTRDQMAVFLLRGEHGSSYVPPTAIGEFQDVPINFWAARWIEQVATEGITVGCASGKFCPTTPVTRDQMAVFLLKAKHGSGYVPPTPTGMFSDVPVNYWAASWIEQLAMDGVTAGCGGGKYCPTTPVTRDQMAVFLVKNFNLP